ncbi:hypothetical protein [Yoonia litorea]|uniref:Replication initiation factor n=1 Tax=Yoonia litorea TaxID=1123755 RepID=A0A1I6N342_9RHOB|nr:hypothetical protein [Yoonia litorea]SFS22261.1 hypothetical protein SAMN05444714_3227 [Yoonia litorea]
MEAEILHSGFDGLRVTIETDIPPALREKLFAAKAEAIETNQEVILTFRDISLGVRRSGGMAFSAHTGEFGAEWYFLDPENRPKNNPGITVDFRAFLLATGGLRAAREHLDTCLTAFGLRWGEHQLRPTRVDFAIDFLAPWFEPDRAHLILPPQAKAVEFTGPADTETHAKGVRVTGLRAGKTESRQLVIYDKRTEAIQKGKVGAWGKIWNATRASMGKPPLDMKDPDQSRVWRFELRAGRKQLRDKFDIRGWSDLEASIGDVFQHFCKSIRYCIPITDQNRARWPTHELWTAVEQTIADNLQDSIAGVLPRDVKEANRQEHMEMLDRQLLGLFVSRAAASGIKTEGFPDFLADHILTLLRASDGHPVELDTRIAKAVARYRWT